MRTTYAALALLGMSAALEVNDEFTYRSTEWIDPVLLRFVNEST